MPIKVSRGRFGRLVADALDSIPDELRRRMQNIDVVVEDWPSAEQLEGAGVDPGDDLFGLYEGTPLIERGVLSEPLLPDKITIFRGPLQGACSSDDEIREEVRRTIIHEVAHHFGFDEDQLANLGYD